MISSALLASALLASPGPLALYAEPMPQFRVVFGDRSVVLSGTADSTTSIEALLGTVKAARPDLVPDSSALAVDPSAPMPESGDLRSLIAELALSTHEGRLELWPDRVVIGGLTDSLVTLSALRIRAEPVLAGRALHNKLCIVGTDDLPELAVSLADGKQVVPEVSSEPGATRETPFEIPGLPLEKLLATLRLLAEVDRLAGTPGSNGEAASAASLPAMPATPESSVTATAPTPLTAIPIDTHETLTSVFFSRNSFLLQINQTGTLDELAKQLLSPARRGASIRVEAVRPSGGAVAFHEYICERRAAEVVRFLSERGVDPGLITTKAIDSSSPIDLGEVRLLVERPAPPDESSETVLPGEEAIAAPPAAAP